MDLADDNADLTLDATRSYGVIRERRSGSGVVMQNIGLEEGHQLDGLIDRLKGTLTPG